MQEPGSAPDPGRRGVPAAKEAIRRFYFAWKRFGSRFAINILGLWSLRDVVTLILISRVGAHWLEYQASRGVRERNDPLAGKRLAGCFATTMAVRPLSEITVVAR